MRISEVIKNLQKIKKENGDLECFTAIDDEGNGYYRVFFDPSIKYIINDIGERYVDLYHDKEELYNDYETSIEEGSINIKTVCLLN